MSKCVLDASAILAIALEERGFESLLGPAFAESVASTVNLAEAQSRLVRLGSPPREAWQSACSTVHASVPFDDEQAQLTGALFSQTRALGLSLGDRACLALGMTLNVPVYTADKAWKKLRLSIPIHIIR
jgi:ribonuclease VapC